MEKEKLKKNIELIREVQGETELEVSDDKVLEIAYKITAQDEYAQLKKQSDNATESQLSYLKKLGYKGDTKSLSKQECSALIEELKKKKYGEEEY